jgi:hypothetical protein
MLWYMPVFLATLEVEVGESQSEAGLGKSTRLYLKNKLKLKGLGLWLVSQVVECLPSKCMALCSILSTTKKKE